MLDATYIAADKTTTRVHLNPRDASWTWSHVRDKSFRNRESHVDAHDGQFEIWKDESIYDGYKAVFEESLENYNSKQKRKDRKILDKSQDPVSAYIAKIQTSRRGKKERVVYKNTNGTKEIVGKKQESQGQRVLYELIVSAGNCEKKRDAQGRIVYTDDGHEIHPMRVPDEVNKAAVKKFYEKFESFYGHFHLTTAAYHADEFYINERGVKEFGVPHGHLCFIAWGDNYKIGMEKQASIGKALEQMGFKNGQDDDGVWHNAYWYFTQDAQKRFEEILQHEYVKYQKEHGVTTGRNGLPVPDGYVPGLDFVHPARGKRLPNLDPERYRELKDVGRKIGAANEELKGVQSVLTAKRNELEQAEMEIADAKEQERNLDEYISLKMQEADQYYLSLKEEADALLRDAEEKRMERVREAERRFQNILDVLKKIPEELELYKKRCEEVLQKKIPLDIPTPAVERWMKKRKMKKDGMPVSVYDACVDEISPVLRRRAEAQYDAADTLRNEVLRQIEITEGYMPDDEDDAKYGFVM